MSIQVYFSVKYGMFEGKIDGKVVSRAKTPERVQNTINKILATGSCRNKNAVKPVSKPKFTIDYAVRDRVITKTEQIKKDAERIFGTDLDGLKVSFFNRGSRAGFARYSSFEVGFNEVLAKENPIEFENTIKHEIAHHVVRKVHPFAKPHGHEFKRTLLLLGGNGKTCHQMDVSNCAQKRTKWVYSCNTCSKEYKVGKKIHTIIQTGNSRGYRCKCGNSISFKHSMVIK